jgi:hypothetical protein
MENQDRQQFETSADQAKKKNGGKRWPMPGLILGTIATVYTVIWLTMSACTTSSRPSTPAEIAAQKEFQEKLNTAQEEYQQKVDAATKEAGERQMELHKKSSTAQEEFQQKIEAATKEAEQKTDSIVKAAELE